MYRYEQVYIVYVKQIETYESKAKLSTSFIFNICKMISKCCKC